MTKRIIKLLSVAMLAVLLVATFALSACGEEKIEEATGLKYSRSSDGYYYVDGIGDETRTKFVIPSEYNGLPVKAIRAYAFRWAKITSIVIPDSVTYIGDSAFADSKLKSVVISNSVTVIGSEVFKNCTGLKSVLIPSSVQYICDSAFDGCSSLKSVTFGENSQLQLIDEYAFRGCSSLTSITISSSVNTIEQGAFSGCTRLSINCEASSQPSGWNSNWNESNCHVVWGYGAD